MPMVLLLPWCRIAKHYDVGHIRLLPFTRDSGGGGIFRKSTRPQLT